MQKICTIYGHENNFPTTSLILLSKVSKVNKNITKLKPELRIKVLEFKVKSWLKTQNFGASTKICKEKLMIK